MSGYTPLFSSLITGTLYGRWPDIGLWTIVLSLADRQGIVDVTPDYLAGVTGLPVAEVSSCMQRFCEPDAKSRSKVENGARLVLIDHDRDWGWQVVNHGKYREKARLMGKAEMERESGKNLQRMKDRRGPPKTAADPPSDSYADSYKSKSPRLRASRLPEDFLGDLEHAKTAIPDIDAEAEFARFRDYWRAKSGANGTKADWPATWRNWIRNCKDSGKYSRAKEAARAKNGLPVLNG